ncbi:MAG TPA: c-type cytochrome [Steroidobacteraceae bacterium]|nr:c-type cytochrome [Steroidobacteraceae bacterium]
MNATTITGCLLSTVVSALLVASPARGGTPDGIAKGDAARGQALYESRCTACHSLDHSRIGPAHRGVFDRLAGSVPGFDYSSALKHSGVRWTAANLNRWLTDPDAFIPGNKMGYEVPDPVDRRDIIAFLASPAAR